MATEIRASTVVAATAGALATGFLAYAVYFDHRRRTDPEYRKALKRENKRLAKAAKEEENAKKTEDIKRVKELLAEANAEGYPTNPEEIELYFMQQVGEGEKKCQNGTYGLRAVSAALLSVVNRRRTSRRGLALLQGLESLPVPRRANQHLRQDGTEGRRARSLSFPSTR